MRNFADLLVESTNLVKIFLYFYVATLQARFKVIVEENDNLLIKNRDFKDTIKLNKINRKKHNKQYKELFSSNELLTKNHGILQSKYDGLKNQLEKLKDDYIVMKDEKKKYKTKAEELERGSNLFKQNLIEIIGGRNNPNSDEQILNSVRHIVHEGNLAIRYNKELVNISNNLITGVNAIENITSNFGNVEVLSNKINNFLFDETNNDVVMEDSSNYASRDESSRDESSSVESSENEEDESSN